MEDQDLLLQKNEWRKKGWSLPDIRGGKQVWFLLICELVKQISNGQANDLDAIPAIQGVEDVQPWRTYASFLKTIGLAKNRAGSLFLTSEGNNFDAAHDKNILANLLQSKWRLFGETLSLLNENPKTIEEVDAELRESYGLEWKHLNNTRRRMDWLEVLDLIEALGGRKWKTTEQGKRLLKGWTIVSPAVVKTLSADSFEEITIQGPPPEIDALLQRLQESPELHKERSTYNIWVPSPNRIENLRTILHFAEERVSKADLFGFIEKEFNLKASSIESMLPFLKVSGLIEEVGRGIYVATPAAKAWIRTGYDLDFIRILHCHMQFVGEQLKFSENDSVRNDLYAKAKNYGLNAEKARWIVGFLVEAGLLEEPQYLHLKTTAIGKALMNTLPLYETEGLPAPVEPEKEEKEKVFRTEIDVLEERIRNASVDPVAEGKASGVAFEEAIAEVFRFMGFDAKRIGGAGDTDVVVRWKDKKGKSVTAIVDGKSKSGGQVFHSDISDVAIETHKDKNNAEYVAIIGPAFAGDTIKNHAKKKQFALISVEEIIEIAKASQKYGLNLSEKGLLFQVPNGLSELSDIISEKQRQMDIITIVVSKFCKEQDTLGGLSPRDLFLLLRDNAISPSLEELLSAFETLSNTEMGVLHVVDNKHSPENTIYALHDGKSIVNKLRALSSAIEKGLSI